MYAKSVIAVAAVAGLVSASPAGVTAKIAPKEPSPAGCSQNYPSSFEIQVVNVTKSNTKRDSTPLIATLKNGGLTDNMGRIGYIASNQQFQFDPIVPQAGAIYTSGFSVCQNGSLALGGTTIFYQCLSGSATGTFYNLYDESIAAQCSPVYIEVLPQGAATTGSATVAQAMKDGQVTAMPVSNVACQISDGQLQENTCTGQVVSQIADGQIQAPTGGVVSQISDGQIQAPTGVAHPVTQIGDGQIQAPVETGKVVSQIADGQIQAPTGTSNKTTSAQPSVEAFTGAASTLGSSIFGLVACVAAVLAL